MGRKGGKLGYGWLYFLIGVLPKRLPSFRTLINGPKDWLITPWLTVGRKSCMCIRFQGRQPRGSYGKCSYRQENLSSDGGILCCLRNNPSVPGSICDIAMWNGWLWSPSGKWWPLFPRVSDTYPRSPTQPSTDHAFPPKKDHAGSAQVQVECTMWVIMPG